MVLFAYWDGERLEEEQCGGEIKSSALAILSLRGQVHVHIVDTK